MNKLHNVDLQANISANEFVESLDKNLKLLRQNLLDEVVLRAPLNYRQKKSDLDVHLNSIYPNLSKEQQESVATILNKHGELNLLDTENLKLLDKSFIQKNGLVSNKLLNQIGEALGAISTYLGMTMLALGPLDPGLFAFGSVFTGSGLIVKNICLNNLDKYYEIMDDHIPTEYLHDSLDLHQNIDISDKNMSVEKNNDIKINPSIEKSDLQEKNNIQK